MGNVCGGGTAIPPPEPVVDAIVATEEEEYGESRRFGASGNNLSTDQFNASGQLNGSARMNNSSGQLNASGHIGSRSSNTLQGQRDASITSLVPNNGMSEMFARQMSEEEEIGMCNGGLVLSFGAYVLDRSAC